MAREIARRKITKSPARSASGSEARAALAASLGLMDCRACKAACPAASRACGRVQNPAHRGRKLPGPIPGVHLAQTRATRCAGRLQCAHARTPTRKRARTRPLTNGRADARTNTQTLAHTQTHARTQTQARPRPRQSAQRDVAQAQTATHAHKRTPAEANTCVRMRTRTRARARERHPAANGPASDRPSSGTRMSRHHERAVPIP